MALPEPERLPPRGRSLYAIVLPVPVGRAADGVVGRGRDDDAVAVTRSDPAGVDADEIPGDDVAGRSRPRWSCRRSRCPPRCCRRSYCRTVPPKRFPEAPSAMLIPMTLPVRRGSGGIGADEVGVHQVVRGRRARDQDAGAVELDDVRRGRELPPMVLLEAPPSMRIPSPLPRASPRGWCRTDYRPPRCPSPMTR